MPQGGGRGVGLAASVEAASLRVVPLPRYVSLRGGG
jgi:hypothetical protein